MYDLNILPDFLVAQPVVCVGRIQCTYVWSVVMMSSSGMYQVVELKLSVFPQILEKKSRYKATYSPDNNLGSQVLVLGHQGGRKKGNITLEVVARCCRKLKELKTCKG